MLTTVSEVKRMLAEGKALIIAGEESLLRELPRGNWIGGTIPYFMTADGGITSRDRLFVEHVPEVCNGTTIRLYDESTINQIANDSPEHGYTVVIVPAFTAIHQSYALNAPEYPNLFFKVISGWIAGIHLDDVGKKTPTVFNGKTGAVETTQAVAMHIELPSNYAASLSIVNIFEQGDGDEITFPQNGFNVTDCLVNGQRKNFHDYFVSNGFDSRLPLVADFCGAMINVSIQALDADKHSMQLYAPVFDGVKYRLAKPITNYPERFGLAIPKDVRNPAFSCNCILNYLYGELEGRRTGAVTGPMTFGEIGYQLLNQTMVYVTIEKTE